MCRIAGGVNIFSAIGGSIIWVLNGVNILPMRYYWAHFHILHAAFQLTFLFWLLRLDPVSIAIAQFCPRGVACCGIPTPTPGSSDKVTGNVGLEHSSQLRSAVDDIESLKSPTAEVLVKA